MATTPVTFNGSSTYSAQLQEVIQHAVTVASIPLTQLNDNVTTLQSQGSTLNTLQTDFAAIQTAFQSLTTAGNGGSLSASTGNSSIATANLNTSASPSAGTYSLNVINPGSPSTSVSLSTLPAVSDPNSTSISTSSSYTLTVNGSTFTVNPASDTLNDLAQSINSSGAPVSATVLNLGSPEAPNYQLSVQSTALGNIPIQLYDGSQNLLSPLTTGVPATYQVNGQPSTPISSDSSTVTLAPGLTVNLAGAGQTTVTVAQDSTAAANALTAFVSAYNTASDELATNRGSGGGALSGESIVFSLQQTLSNITNYSGGTGSVTNIAALGLSFDGTGHLTFNQSQFTAIAASNPGDVASFLGTGTGSGFLANAANDLTGLLDPTNGVFQSQYTTIQDQINTDNQEISDTQSRITTMQNDLTAQMSAADALIAGLQSQNTFLTQLFQAQNAIATSGS